MADGVRYLRRGVSRVYFVKDAGSISDVSAPTTSEIGTLGTDTVELTCDIGEITGFSFQNNPIDTPDLCNSFVPKIPGEDTADDSEMTFYEVYDDSNPGQAPSNNAAWDLLQKGQSGYVLFFPWGLQTGDTPDTGDEGECWPVSVAKATRQWSAGNDAAKFMVTFTITGAPSQEMTIGS